MELVSCILDMIPFAAMIMVECTDVGIATISKAAMTKGMSSYVFVVYSNTLGALFLFPFVLMKRYQTLFTFHYHSYQHIARKG